MFYDDYYGKIATKATVVKLAETKIDNITCHYSLFDFTSGGEPTDGSGPFYYGWLSEDYFE